MRARFCQALLMVAFTGSVVRAAATVLHVSPQGNDAWSGALAAPNADGTDGPVATFGRARDELRAHRPAGPAAVLVHRGIYRLTDTLAFTAADSGTEAAPIVWRAAQGEEVRVTGGVRLTGWQPVTDPAVVARLAKGVAEHLRVVDLAALGVKDFGGVAPGAQRAEVFFDHQYLTLARYPNEGWARIAAIPKGAATARPISDPKRPDINRYEGPFLYDGDRPSQWQNAQHVWVHGYWFHDWADQYQEVAKFDLARHELWPKPPYHGYGYKANQRYYYLNLLEELDQPGEWYLDRDTGKLYLWPPASLESAEVTFPELAKPMVALTDVAHVQFQGMVFECARAGAIVVNGGSQVEIAGCTVRNVGGTGIAIQGGDHHTVRSCDIYEVAGTGISLQGGDRKTLARGDHAVENCHIHHFARVRKTYQPAIQIGGVGNRISHCLIHDAPHMGIGYAGNDHLIEYTEITRVAQETGDVGAIYAAMDWTYTGHVFRYNYFHHIHGPGNLGCFTIYPDLPCGGIHLLGNVFQDVDQVFHTNSGRGMLVENNLFLDCRGLSFSVWGDQKKFELGGNWRMVERLQEVNYDQPPYSTRYPMLARLAEDFAKGEEHVGDRAIPRDNMLRHNVSLGHDFFLRVGPQASFADVQVEWNLIANPVVFIGSPTGDGKAKTYRNDNPEIRQILGENGNIIVAEPPKIEDFRLVDTALATQIGFETIPMDQIGLQRDSYRAELPVVVFPPVIRPESRRFLGTQAVEILPVASPRGQAYTLRYTLDGSVPTAQSPVYTQPLTLPDTVTVTAAMLVGTALSAPVSATYTAIHLAPDGIYLSDLEEQDLLAYMPCWKKDHNHTGGPIRLAGQTYQRGILLHPCENPDGNRGSVTYLLTGELAKATVFTATIGIDDAMQTYKKGSATFAVDLFRNGAWERVFTSGVLKLGDPSEPVRVELNGAEKLRLVTTDGGDGIACDHATWADPLLR